MYGFFSHRDYLFQYIEKSAGGELGGDIHFPAVMIAVAAVLVFSWVSQKLYAIRPDYRRYDPSEYEEKWRGFKRMLIPFLVLVALEPLRVLLAMANDYPYYLADTWRAVAQEGGKGYDLWFPSFLTLSIIFPSVQFLFAILLALLAWRRKRAFRLLAVLYLALAPLSYMVYDVILSRIFGRNDMILTENLAVMFTWIKVAVLGIPFILISRRINATFQY